MAQVDGTHPRAVLVGIQAPGFKIIIGGLRRTRWDWALQAACRAEEAGLVSPSSIRRRRPGSDQSAEGLSTSSV